MRKLLVFILMATSIPAFAGVDGLFDKLTPPNKLTFGVNLWNIYQLGDEYELGLLDFSYTTDGAFLVFTRWKGSFYLRNLKSGITTNGLGTVMTVDREDRGFDGIWIVFQAPKTSGGNQYQVKVQLRKEVSVNNQIEIGKIELVKVEGKSLFNPGTPKVINEYSTDEVKLKRTHESHLNGCVGVLGGLTAIVPIPPQ